MSLAPIERIEAVARMSILRALGFAALAIITAMTGFSFVPSLACKVGGTLALLVAAILVLLANRVPHIDYRRTETYLMLDGKTGLDESMAGRIIRQTQIALYRKFAAYHAYAGSALLLISFVV